MKKLDTLRYMYDHETNEIVLQRYGSRIELSMTELAAVLNEVPAGGWEKAKEGVRDNTHGVADQAPSNAELVQMYAYYEDYDVRYRDASKEFAKETA